MRQTHGSRRAENVREASPPNSPVRYGRGVGPWRKSAELSAASLLRVRYLLKEHSVF